MFSGDCQTPHYRKYYGYRKGEGSRAGVPVDYSRCAKAIGEYREQCKRRRGHGPLRSFCKQHGEMLFEELRKTGVRDVARL